MGQEKMPALNSFVHHYCQVCSECKTSFNLYYLPSKWELELLRGIHKKCPSCDHMIFIPFSEKEVNVVVQEYLNILKCTHPELITF